MKLMQIWEIFTTVWFNRKNGHNVLHNMYSVDSLDFLKELHKENSLTTHN